MRSWLVCDVNIFANESIINLKTIVAESIDDCHVRNSKFRSCMNHFDVEQKAWSTVC